MKNMRMTMRMMMMLLTKIFNAFLNVMRLEKYCIIKTERGEPLRAIKNEA